MINRDDEPRGSMTWTALAGLGLQLVPLPALIAPARPAFAVLAVIYWSLLAPRAFASSATVAGLKRARSTARSAKIVPTTAPATISVPAAF